MGKMKKQFGRHLKLKDLFKKLEKDHDRQDKLHLNILWHLTSHKINNDNLNKITIEDLLILYDNLYINNEIVTGDNVDEYNDYLLTCNISKRIIEEIKQYKKCILLNYYKKVGSYEVLTDCKIYFKYIDDVLIYE